MPDPVTRLNVALEGRYVIERELGEGGMATVYLAEDLKHSRKVALKVLKPDLAAVLGVERFLVEISTTASVQHPHVLPLFDSGEADGFLFYAMPYVEGVSLRERLDRERQLPVDETLSLITDVAAALHAAHEQGIVHRDIKPANIMLSSGGPLVADFGIALAVGEAGGERLTQTGLSIGTPHYMSPEQAAGESHIDKRSDIYSLASMLYEMLAGEPPYTGATAQVVLTKRLVDPVPSVRRIRERVPESVDAAIQQALAPVPADRFATMTEFTDALATAVMRGRTKAAWWKPWAASGAAAAIVTAIVIALGRVGGGITDASTADIVPEEAIPSASIAVLPFTNRSSDPDQEYFSDGLAEGILNVLAQVTDLRVTSRSSAFAFKGQALALSEVASQLGVAHLLEGSVQKIGEQVRISVSLIEAATDRRLWADQFDRDVSNVFRVQDEISAAIVEALLTTMGLESPPLIPESQIVSAEAYDFYLRGLQTSGLGTREGFRAARSHFEQAIAIEPTYALAHARLSRTLLDLGGPPNDSVRGAANEAIRLDPSLGLPYTVLSMVETREGRGVGRSDSTFKLRARGYELAPNDPWVTLQYARAFENTGRVPESEPLMRKAVELDPLDVVQRTIYGNYLALRGRTAEAVRQVERAVQIAPANPRTWLYKGEVTGNTGDLVSSIGAFLRYHELVPDNSLGASRVAAGYLELGDFEAARAWMGEARRRGGPQDLGFEARYLVWTGQPEEALDMALRVFESRGPPFPNVFGMQVVVSDMINRGALEEAEDFLLRYENRLADFMTGPIPDPNAFPYPAINERFAMTLQDVYKRAGRTEEAQALTDRLGFTSMQGFWSRMQLGWHSGNHHREALWHMQNGRHAEALDELEQAVEVGFRQEWRPQIRDNFLFDDVREDPRFGALIETIEADLARQREMLAEGMPALEEELAAIRSSRISNP